MESGATASQMAQHAGPRMRTGEIVEYTALTALFVGALVLLTLLLF
jgi:hypothetical protein